MNCILVIAVVAAIAPLSSCQDLLYNPNTLQVGYNDVASGSSAQAQAQAQAQASSDSNAAIQSYLNALQLGPSIAGAPCAMSGMQVGIPAGLQATPGVSVLSGAGLPGASSSIPALNPYATQDAVQESLAETNMAGRIRQGAIQVVPPNLSAQAVLQSVQVPVQGRYNNRVYASQPMPPMIVSQPGSPPVQISSGPAAVVSAAPVIYRQPPNVVYQNEVINRHPAPLSLNPVYVKVYKPGKKVIAPRPVGAVVPTC